MLRLSDIRKFFILLTITLMIMFIIPNLAVAGHGGMGGMGGGMGGCCGMGGGYYGGYFPATSASWLGRYTPYATTLGGPYSAYGYSPYSSRIGGVLGSPLGGYGLGYSGLGIYGGMPYGGGLYGYGGGSVMARDYGLEQTYTTYVPGGEISTSVSEGSTVVPGFGYGYGGLLGGYGLGAYGLGGGYGLNPYGYGLGATFI